MGFPGKSPPSFTGQLFRTWHLLSHGNIVLNYASLVTQTVKRLPTMRDTRVRSQGREYPLEKEMATHSSTLACKIPWTEEPSGLQSLGSQRDGHDRTTSLNTFSFFSKLALKNIPKQ